MASLIFSKVHGRMVCQGTLLEAVAAADNGTWLPAGGFHPMTLHVTGITVATVEACGSCEPVKPSNSTHGFPLKEVTEDGGFLLDVPVQWIKARVTSYTSGTIYAYVTGSEGTY